jgi:tetratricopeptide (TPR) repeat protein
LQLRLGNAQWIHLLLVSRALINLRAGRPEEALADFDSALAISPRLASALYGRGLVEVEQGDRLRGTKDLEAAKAIYDGVDSEFARYGIK